MEWKNNMLRNVDDYWDTGIWKIYVAVRVDVNQKRNKNKNKRQNHIEDVIKQQFLNLSAKAKGNTNAIKKQHVPDTS